MKKLTGFFIAALITPLFLLAFADKDASKIVDKKKKEVTVTEAKIIRPNNRARFQKFDEEQLLKALDEVKATNGFETNKFIITRTTNSNAAEFTVQVEDFLNKNGYNSMAYGTVSMQLQGYKVVRHQSCLEIIVGIL